MTRKTTEQEIIKRVRDAWGDDFFISNYKNSKELVVTDTKTLKNYTVTVANFIKNRHDPRKILEKKEDTLIQNMILDLYGDEFILVNYINANNLIIKDQRNILYKTTFAHLITERKNPHNLPHKYSTEEIAEIIEKKSNKTLKLVGKYYGVNKRITLKCITCGNTFSTAASHIIRDGTRCPFCLHQKVSQSNCILNSPYRYKFESFLTTEQMTHYMPHSMQKIEVTCPVCQQKKQIAPDTIFSMNGIGCICGDGFSYPNKFMYCLLNQCHIAFEREKKFEWAEKKMYDFYIPSKNLIIEMHGLQHYSNGHKGTSLLQIQTNDKLKKELALRNLNCIYVEINASKSNLDFIKTQIINSGLLGILSINTASIDFEECDKFSIKHNLLSSLVDEYRKNNGFNLKSFANKNKISLTLAYKLLNQAIHYKLINNYHKRDSSKKRVRCIETGEVFNTIAEANRKYHANVNKALKKHSLANHCHWEIVD